MSATDLFNILIIMLKDVLLVIMVGPLPTLLSKDHLYFRKQLSTVIHLYIHRC